MKAFTGFALAAAVAYTSLEAVSAMPSFVALLPNGATLGGELIGHDGGSTSGKFTAFGTLFSEKGKKWDAVCNEKFPGKDFTVGAAFGDACCKWKGEGASPEAAPKWEAGQPTEGTTCATDASTAPSTAPTPAASDAYTPAPTTAPTTPAPAPAGDEPTPAPASGKPTPAPPASGKPTPAPTGKPGPGKPGSGKCRTKEDDDNSDNGGYGDHKQRPTKPGKHRRLATTPKPKNGTLTM
ncbi:hypothetical protein Poli38472_009578 [Pythium oligandrum]|uniref:Temptin Cys/Cys disulfide domain-containing protein n=1 Tax=Pythium oligandrum TaxID=41045 RepID=A0A8K1FFV4_PYTOL|nr:hypothetical protein Poli38472_009578 [Pythium oligandrum]|eukprot:TMW62085.1 hypothetical protein Poli38472_009578 [Pythium oligandrum]